MTKTEEKGVQKATIKGLDPAIIESLVLNGNIGGLTAQQKIEYYNEFCKHLGLNPITQPFQVLKFQGKEVLYATKNCTEQLRQLHGVSVIKQDIRSMADVYIVTVTVQNKHGRQDLATGALKTKGLTGDALANAIMKCETKAKRRATLSICGLGMLDETEVETISHDTVEQTVEDIEDEQKNESEILEDVIKEVEACKTLDELKKVWASYNFMQVNAAFAEAKEKRKKQLTGEEVPEAEVIEEEPTKEEKS